MNTHQQEPSTRANDRKSDRSENSQAPSLANARARVIRHASSLAAALLAVAALVAGCGKHALDSTTSVPGSSQSTVQETPGEPAVLASQGAAGSSQERTSDQAREPDSSAARNSDSLPPEVDAAAVDSVVTPGAVVEISALASEDVVDMGLSDGIGKERPFAYDSTMNVWRALYRVPIRNSKDRIGLAVTATNQAGHWRRVWVFLNLQQ